MVDIRMSFNRFFFTEKEHQYVALACDNHQLAGDNGYSRRVEAFYLSFYLRPRLIKILLKQIDSVGKLFFIFQRFFLIIFKLLLEFYEAENHLGFFMYYSFFRNVISRFGPAYLIDNYIGTQSGQSVLDIGCGPASIFPYLGDVVYYGVDCSSQYIDAALAKYGNKCYLFCRDLDEYDFSDIPFCDLVTAIGVLHHLSDEQVVKILKRVYKRMKIGSKFISFDGVYVSEQSKIAKWFLKHDRGAFVRTTEEYLTLFRKVFDDVRYEIRDDLLRIPYNHIIIYGARLSENAANSF